MKEQKIYDVTVIEVTEKIHEGSGNISGIDRRVLFDSKVPAVTQEAAKQKALKGLKEVDYDNLEITCCPFPG
jgi:hypothetical protein